MSVRDDIVDGIARTLWITAYAEWVESLSKAQRKKLGTPVSLSGIEWDDASPDTPEACEKAARELAEMYETENGVSLEELARRAAKADGVRRVDEGAFGYCLAMQATGSGVSWTDDHQEFEISDPDFECDFDGEFFNWSGRTRTPRRNPGRRKNPGRGGVRPAPGDVVVTKFFGTKEVKRVCMDRSGEMTAYLDDQYGGELSVTFDEIESIERRR